MTLLSQISDNYTCLIPHNPLIIDWISENDPKEFCVLCLSEWSHFFHYFSISFQMLVTPFMRVHTYSLSLSLSLSIFLSLSLTLFFYLSFYLLLTFFLSFFLSFFLRLSFIARHAFLNCLGKVECKMNTNESDNKKDKIFGPDRGLVVWTVFFS